MATLQAVVELLFPGGVLASTLIQWWVVSVPCRAGGAGEWKDNDRHGRGKQDYADGSVYEGQWGDDMRSGTGICTYPDNSRYEGGHVDDAMLRGGGADGGPWMKEELMGPFCVQATGCRTVVRGWARHGMRTAGGTRARGRTTVGTGRESSGAATSRGQGRTQHDDASVVGSARGGGAMVVASCATDHHVLLSSCVCWGGGAV